MRSQFDAMKPASNAWLVTHRPVWGFKNKSFKKDDPLNATLQAALVNSGNKLPAGFSLAVAGHIHIWEVLSFADNRSPQFVLGNGGTELGKEINNKKFKGAKVGGTTVSYGYSVDKWGFTIFTPKDEEARRKLDRDLLLDQGEQEVQLQGDPDGGVIVQMTHTRLCCSVVDQRCAASNRVRRPR